MTDVRRQRQRERHWRRDDTRRRHLGAGEVAADRGVPVALPSRIIAIRLGNRHGRPPQPDGLDFAFGRFCRRQPAPPARAALLVGTWQLLFGDDIPDYAAINETVEAAKRARAALPSFVNGVLRNVLRNREAILGELAAAPLHVRTSHPQEIVERWRKAFGDEKAAEICEAGLAVPMATAFALPRDGLSAEEATAALATRWRAAGIDSPPEVGNGSLALPIPHGVRIADLPGYAEGEFIIQDKAAFATVADFLEPLEGETILDCCAAPGGKTMQAAARVGGEGRVIALD
ncbi:MAG: hypothetical protein IKO40_10995, partial [Kiritimatiellae bacterium]|nr:hypothetical protein [Kiritimatiellia bacterium]